MRRLLVLVLTVALTALAGCGDDEVSDEAALRSKAREAAQEKTEARLEERNARVAEEYEKRQSTEALDEEEVEAKQTTTRFYDILAAEKGGPNRTTLESDSFCSLMSEKAVEETVRYARVSSGIQREWDCESAIEFLVLRSKRNAGFKPTRKAEVLGVNAEGDQAVATVRFGNGPATAVPLVREDGEWKLGATGVGR